MITLKEKINYLLNEGNIDIPSTQLIVEFYKFEDGALYYLIRNKENLDTVETNNVKISSLEDLENLLKYKFNGIKDYEPIPSIVQSNANAENLLIFLVNQGYLFFTDIPIDLYNSLSKTVDLDKFKEYNNEISKSIEQFNRIMAL